MPDYKLKYVGRFSCDLVLDPNNILRPGGFIKGRFFISNKEKVNCYGILACVYAESTVGFKIGNDVKGINRNLFQNADDIWGNIWELCRNKKPITPRFHQLPPGKHNLPFNLTLPDNRPGTFTSSYGKIRYAVGAVMITVGRGCPNMCFKWINIEHRVNLYLQPELFHPAEIKVVENKPLSLWFVKKNKDEPKLKLLFKLPKTGFIRGEDLPFSVEIENPTEETVESINVSLVRKTIYKAEGSTKTVEDIIATLCSSEENDSQKQIQWYHKIVLPNDIIPSFKATGMDIPYGWDRPEMIELFYLLKVVVNRAQGALPLKGEFLVSIGTVNEVCETPNDDSNQVATSSSGVSSSIKNSSRTDLRKHSVSSLPSYSQLSFCFGGSMISLTSNETLPPTYDDVMDN